MTGPTSTLVIAAALYAGVAGCLLYTDPINTRPSVTITPPGGPFGRGKVVTITATGSDADSDPLKYAWFVVEGGCDQAPDFADAPASTAAGRFQFQLPQDAATPFCVWVRVTDSHGAVSDPKYTLVLAHNTPPVAKLTVQVPSTPNDLGRYNLYTSFRISAADSTDADGDAVVPRAWTWVGFPLKASPKLVDCSPTPPANLVQCFDAGEFPGLYTLRLVVTDGLDDSVPQDLALTVDPDHPACIDEVEPSPDASPLIWNPVDPRTFQIDKIYDDGAPWPTPNDGRAHMTPLFTWSLRTNGGAWSDLGGFESQNAVTLPGGSFVVGDHVDVRVVISDGMKSHAVTTCDPRCPAGCPDAQLWSVEYR